MIIAQKLRKANISEYLLYMWQIEDLLRAMNLDMDLVKTNLIAGFKLSDAKMESDVVEWYESLIDMMRRENVIFNGHLQINKNVIIELEDFHSMLLRTAKVPAYNAKFFHVLPIIQKVKMQGDEGAGDIEQCFNFQYGILMLKLSKKEISKETLQSQTEISKFLVLLAKNYNSYQAGEIDLDEAI